MDTRILLVEDEEHLARGLRFNFESEGYEVEVVERGEQALELLLGGDAAIDLVVLDVRLPGISGLDVLGHLRAAERNVPVLLLTARDSELDVVRGLDMGADDYLTKPFSLPVLLARVRTLLRRAERAEEPLWTSFAIGEVEIHPSTFEVERADGTRSALTAKELGLLQLLHARRGQAVSRGDILQDVWELHPKTQTRVVDTFVRRLRKLIEPDPAAPRYLLSVRSFGYRLVNAPEEPEAAKA